MNRKIHQGNTYSSLRKADEKVGSRLYEDLAEKVLITILKLQQGNKKPVSLALLKDHVNMNFAALNRILGDLAREKDVLLTTDYPTASLPSPEQIEVSLSDSGIERAEKLLYSFKSFAY